MNKFLKFSIAVLVLSALIAWFQPSVLYNPVYIHNAVLKVPFLKSFFKYFHGSKAPVSNTDKKEPPSGPDNAATASNQDVRIFTKEELANYKGENDGEIYLSILGIINHI